MNAFPTPLLAPTFVADRTARYEHAATVRRLVRRALRDRARSGRDPDLVAQGAVPPPAGPDADHQDHVLVALPAATGATRTTGTASSPMASQPVDRVA